MDIQEIEQDGSVRMKIAKMMRELIPLVQTAYPGYSVYIDAKNESNGSTPPESSVDLAKDRQGFSLLPKRDQIATVLQAKNRPMQKQAIFDEIQTRGGNMSFETLSSYLTRYACFQKEGGGLWSLRL